METTSTVSSIKDENTDFEICTFAVQGSDD